MKPPQSFRLYGTSCAYCGTPAQHLEIHTQGRVVIHAAINGRRKSPCTALDTVNQPQHLGNAA